MTDLYRQEDAQQILQLAIARQVESGDITREQLIEIADELGISPQDLVAAERDWLARQGDRQEQQAFNAYRRSQFRQHATKYLIINGFLVTLNWMAVGELSWSLYIAVIWAMLLSLDAWKSFQTDGDRYERMFQQWRRKRQFRQSVSTLFDRWLKP
jgi:hypothetical protein